MARWCSWRRRDGPNCRFSNDCQHFRPIFNEVLFVEMKPEDGIYEPLVGYIVLEQSQAGVDMLGHRLVPIKHMKPQADHSMAGGRTEAQTGIPSGAAGL